MKELRSATCQFSVEADIQHNLKWILKQIEQAADQKADVVHFSECALSGYAGVDIPDIASLDWQDLAKLAADPNVTFGSATVNYSALSSLRDADAER